MTSNSAMSKVFRQIAYLIEFEAKGNEDIDNEYKGGTESIRIVNLLLLIINQFT
jgi:hypothetical protein